MAKQNFILDHREETINFKKKKIVQINDIYKMAFQISWDK